MSNRNQCAVKFATGVIRLPACDVVFLIELSVFATGGDNGSLLVVLLVRARIDLSLFDDSIAVGIENNHEWLSPVIDEFSDIIAFIHESVGAIFSTLSGEVFLSSVVDCAVVVCFFAHQDIEEIRVVCDYLGVSCCIQRATIRKVGVVVLELSDPQL